MIEYLYTLWNDHHNNSEYLKYLYTLWNDHHNKFEYYLSPCIVTIFFSFFFSCDEGFKCVFLFILTTLLITTFIVLTIIFLKLSFILALGVIFYFYISWNNCKNTIKNFILFLQLFTFCFICLLFYRSLFVFICAYYFFWTIWE